MTHGPPALVEARNLERRTPDGRERLLRGISLSIQAGERLAIVGATGSGKTLLLRSLALLDPIDGGEVLWKGTSIEASDIPRYRSQVTYLHQHPALLGDTVEACLRHPFFLRTHQGAAYERDQAVALLQSLGRNSDFLSKACRDLSGGERQLTALIRAMLLAPAVLLLDEPTAALDAASVESVETLVNEWLTESADARAIVWVTHDAQQVRRTSDHVVTMQSGQLLAEN
jgi:putative ABC transport system ATP-binding protein